MPISKERRFGLLWLLGAAAAPTLLWQAPFGQYALYPFSILATWFHEMGHGLTALLLGGSFSHLMLFPGGGGIAVCGASGRVAGALVSAGGLMGPPVAGFFFLIASTRETTVRRSLWLLGCVMLLSAVIWVRTLFGCAAVSLIGLAILAVAMRGSVGLQAWCVKLIGVQACIASYRSRHYMFSAEAEIGGRLLHSDTANMAARLWLPYWFWGTVLLIASLALLARGLYLSTDPEADAR